MPARSDSINYDISTIATSHTYNEVEPMTIWKLVEECARQLTENGISPFTRVDIIKCVQRKNAAYGPDSINPIIQGLTDNHHGGAPGAVGARLVDVAVLGGEPRAAATEQQIANRVGARRRDHGGDGERNPRVLLHCSSLQ